MAVSFNDPDGTFRLYGGFADAALHLTLASRRMVSRQLVYRWWTKREKNGFPDAVNVALPGGTTAEMFDLIQVAAWYDTYVPAKGGRPRKTERTNDHVA